MPGQDIHMLVTAPTLSSCNGFIAFLLVDVHSLLFMSFLLTFFPRNVYLISGLEFMFADLVSFEE
jgi:hypothetical protein